MIIGNAIDRLEREKDLLLGDCDNTAEIRRDFSKEMSRAAGAIRSRAEIEKLAERIKAVLSDFSSVVSVSSKNELYKAYRLKDTLLSQYVYLSAMSDYVKNGGASRGSAIYLEAVNGFDSLFDFADADKGLLSKIQETALDGSSTICTWRSVHPLPDGGGVFETVWREYREEKIYE